MAPKRNKLPIEGPPFASSPSKEAEEVEESGEESNNESRKPSSPPPQQNDYKPDQPQSESKSESGSDSNSESEPEIDRIVKHRVSQPMEEVTTTKTAARASANDAEPKISAASMAVKSTGKRCNGTDLELKDAKKAKNKGAGPEQSQDKKKRPQRVWSEDDEVALLMGIVDFSLKQGCDRSKDMPGFCGYIKKYLHFDPSNTQVKDKISKMKNKFKKHFVEGKKVGEGHDRIIFDLSKPIWGNEWISKGGAEPSVKVSGKKNDMGMNVGVGILEDYVVGMGLNLVKGAEKEKMEKEWRKLHDAEVELCVKRNKLMKGQASLILAALRNKED